MSLEDSGFLVRALGWLRRGVALLDRLSPSRSEAWIWGVGSLIPLAVLVAERIVVARRMGVKPEGYDLAWIQLGELEFWPLWFVVWMLTARLPLRFWGGFLRLLFHICIVVILAFSVAELAFFDVTGGRGDLDTVTFGLRDLPRVWPVVASELTPMHYVGVAAFVGLTLLPLVWRPRTTGPNWVSRLMLLAVLPAIWMETHGRERPSKAMKPLQKTFLESLFWEALERAHDVETPPDPGELDPVRISAPTTPYNVVVVLMESVGARRTTLHNPALATTPALSELAANGIYAQQMYAAVPHTSKALVTTLCGYWPDLTGDAHEAEPGGLPGRCLAQLLREQGYRTAFFQTAREDFEDRVDLVHQMGFAHFRSRDTLAGPMWEKNNYFGIDDRAMLQPGIDWSTADPDRPFLATYLNLASHHDYKLPSYAPLFDFPRASGRLEQYFNAVRYVDDFLDRLVRGYKEAGLYERTLFVILGDHGEGFGEHGRYQHDLTIYEEGLHIPFVMAGTEALQGRTGAITGLRQQIDVLPTILEVLGSKVESGRLLGASVFSEPDPTRVLYHSCWRAHRCLARREGKDIFLFHYDDPPAQLFDFVSDEAQRKDKIGGLAPEQAARWTEELLAWRGRVRGRYEASRAAWIEAQQRPDESPAFATWGGSLSLLACAAENPHGGLVPSDQAWIRCRWRAERELTEAWTMDVQVKAGARTGRADWSPMMGVHKMWLWKPGWSIDDTFRAEIPMYSREGTATVSIGFKRITGLFVKTDDGKERVDVAVVDVVKRDPNTEAGREGITLQPREPWPESFSLPLLSAAAAKAAGASLQGDATEGDDTEGDAAHRPDGSLDAEPPLDDDRDAPAEAPVEDAHDP